MQCEWLDLILKVSSNKNDSVILKCRGNFSREGSFSSNTITSVPKPETGRLTPVTSWSSVGCMLLNCPPLQQSSSTKQREAKGCPREGLVGITESVCPEGCLMSLTEPLVSGFPPHAALSALQ